MPKFPIAGPTYQGRSVNVNAQRCVNFYPEPDASQDKASLYLVGTPGLSAPFCTIGSAPVRDMTVYNGYLWVVAGSALHKIDNAGNVSGVLGTLQTSVGRVGFQNNGLSPTGGDQLIITDGINGYLYNVNTSIFTTLYNSGATYDTVTGFPKAGANTVTFLDGYFIIDIGGAGSGRWMVSALYNGANWNSLDVSTADSTPDALMAVVMNRRELWLIGEKSTEVWYDAGAGRPPFARIPSGIIPFGTPARWSIAGTDNSLIWLGQSQESEGAVVKTNGYSVERISTPQMEYLIDQYSSVADAFAYVYGDEGHMFYVLTFPTGNATWVYDLTTGMWHERSMWSVPYAINRHRSNCYAFFNGKHLVGDYANGNIYQLTHDSYTDNGDPIVSMRRTVHVSKDMKRVFFSELNLDLETGTGLDGLGSSGGTQGGTGVAPSVTLRCSRDGGHTWGNGRTVSMGAIGSYKNRVMWRRLGYARDMVFEITMSDPVKKVILSANLELAEGNA